MALMKKLIDEDPSTYDKVAHHGVWQEAMIDEYASIMKNDVWEVVPRLEGKKVVGSKWIYKVKNATYGSMDKYKSWFMANGFPNERELTMRRLLPWWPSISQPEQSNHW
jgi:hypothetical protein